ncbi:MAG: hypothetical protein ACO4AY_12830 [Ilumatobacteraceae bacterium]
MTTATSNQAIGGVQVYVPTVTEALLNYGIQVYPEGKVLVNLTGYAPGLTITIVCRNVEELVQLEDTFSRCVHDVLYKQRQDARRAEVEQ